MEEEEEDIIRCTRIGDECTVAQPIKSTFYVPRVQTLRGRRWLSANRLADWVYDVVGNVLLSKPSSYITGKHLVIALCEAVTRRSTRVRPSSHVTSRVISMWRWYLPPGSKMLVSVYTNSKHLVFSCTNGAVNWVIRGGSAWTNLASYLEIVRDATSLLSAARYSGYSGPACVASG